MPSRQNLRISANISLLLGSVARSNLLFIFSSKDFENFGLRNAIRILPNILEIPFCIMLHPLHSDSFMLDSTPFACARIQQVARRS